MNNLEPELKELFDLAGLDERHLKDVNTAKFIYNFIEEHGGVEAVKRQGRGKPAPPVPISQPCVPAVPPGPYSGGLCRFLSFGEPSVVGVGSGSFAGRVVKVYS